MQVIFYWQKLMAGSKVGEIMFPFIFLHLPPNVLAAIRFPLFTMHKIQNIVSLVKITKI